MHAMRRNGKEGSEGGEMLSSSEWKCHIWPVYIDKLKNKLGCYHYNKPQLFHN